MRTIHQGVRFLLHAVIPSIGLLTSQVYAHDYYMSSQSEQGTWADGRLSYMPIDRGLNSPVPTDQNAPWYVIWLPNKWAQTQTIHVCFVGGSAGLRNRIINIAQTWVSETNLTLAKGINGWDCAKNDTSEIRIGFNEPGYWSYIGNDSLSTELISKNLNSMNLRAFDTAPPAEPYFSGLVLHEFGHALGLHHEHQSPDGGCDDRILWDKLYTYYDNLYKRDKDWVDTNYRELKASHSAYDWSAIDRASIMVYASDPFFLKDGMKDKCYFQANYKLSDLDLQGIKRAYPKQNATIALSTQAVTLPIALTMPLDDDFRRALASQLELAEKTLLVK